LNQTISSNEVQVVLVYEPQEQLTVYSQIFVAGFVTIIIFRLFGKVLRSIKVFTGAR
jgi:hypothetical protein